MDSLKKEKLVRYWLEGAVDDLKTAKDIAEKTDRYVSALFFLHLAIEKALKSKFVERFSEYAPYTHNLLHLGSKLQIAWSEEQEALAAAINEFNLEARYPDEKYTLTKKATQEFCLSYLKKGEALQAWILSQSSP